MAKYIISLIVSGFNSFNRRIFILMHMSETVWNCSACE